MSDQSQKNTVVNVAVAIATVCKRYELSAEEVLEMFEALGHTTPEQRTKTIITCTAFAVKDMMDNKLKFQEEKEDE